MDHCTTGEGGPLQVKKKRDAGPSCPVGRDYAGGEYLGRTELLSDPQGYILFCFMKYSGTAHMAINVLYTHKISKK